MTEHHSAPEIVVHRDHDDDRKRIGLVDDYGQKIEGYSCAQQNGR